MSMVLKIAAGVLIGLLAYQAIIYQNYEYQTIEYKKQIAEQKAEYENQRKEILGAQQLRTSLTGLTNAISSYYRKNKTLPRFISDLKCSGRYSNYGKSGCATLYDDGVFYVNRENEWTSVEPYILDGKLYNKCKTTIPLSSSNGAYQDCSRLDISAIPEKKSPPFDCGTAVENVDKIICGSDELIAGEFELSSAYKTLLEQKPASEKQKIIDDQNNFINQRRKACLTSDCIREMTSKKILRLEFLGIGNSKR